MPTAPTKTAAPTVTPAYLRRTDAARYLSIAPRTLTQWMQRGILPYSKPARKVCLFAVSDLDKAMRRFRHEAVA